MEKTKKKNRKNREVITVKKQKAMVVHEQIQLSEDVQHFDHIILIKRKKRKKIEKKYSLQIFGICAT